MPSARDDDPRLFDTAYHEAGHVIAALAYNLEFDKVTAIHAPEAGPHNHGAVIRKKPVAIHGGHNQLAALIHALAGPMAEALANERGDFPHAIRQWYDGDDTADDGDDPISGPDFDQLAQGTKRLYKRFGYVDEGEFVQRVGQETEKLLRDHWPRVEKLARSLIQRKSHSLTHPQVCRLLAVDPNCPAIAFMPFATRLSEDWRLTD
jgi:hypothetical protein